MSKINKNTADKLLFSLQVRFTHPSMSAEAISDALGRQAERMWSAGDARTTPTGRVLEGNQTFTYWSYSELKRDTRSFFKELIVKLSEFEHRRDFLEMFTATGGETMIVVGLSGRVNIGDVLSVEHLSKISEAGFSLGVEVYPDMT